MRVVGYVRVSTGKQDVSPELQRDKIQTYCKLHDYQLTQCYEDRVSGKSMEDRKGLQKALQDVDNGLADGVIVYKLDRLCRSVADFSYLVKEYFGEKCSLICVHDHIDTSTPVGRFQSNVLMAVAELEREQIVERIEQGLKHKRENGKVWCKRLYGYKKNNGNFVPCPKEQEAIGIMCHLRKEGYGLPTIGKILQKCGFKTPKGKKEWRYETIDKIVKRTEESQLTQAS